MACVLTGGAWQAGGGGGGGGNGGVLGFAVTPLLCRRLALGCGGQL